MKKRITLFLTAVVFIFAGIGYGKEVTVSVPSSKATFAVPDHVMRHQAQQAFDSKGESVIIDRNCIREDITFWRYRHRCSWTQELVFDETEEQFHLLSKKESFQKEYFNWAKVLWLFAGLSMGGLVVAMVRYGSLKKYSGRALATLTLLIYISGCSLFIAFVMTATLELEPTKTTWFGVSIIVMYVLSIVGTVIVDKRVVFRIANILGGIACLIMFFVA